MNPSILVTGVAGFIGSHVAESLLCLGYDVVGIDSLNSYYDVQLKLHRLENLQLHGKFAFEKLDLAHQADTRTLFEHRRFTQVIHMAAQAGVRYSLENPHAYVDSNVVGFMNVLEGSRTHGVEQLIYASSSSVYGRTTSTGTTGGSAEDLRTDSPLSLYAATKKANELIAYSYGHMFGLRSVGLRFFSVYGPWGRPDMALYKFTKAILEETPIDVYNFGNMKRDFSYIDDVVAAVVAIFESGPKDSDSIGVSKIYNVGTGAPVELPYLIQLIEKYLGKSAKLNYLPMQRGDVTETHADVSALSRDYSYSSTVAIEEGIRRFIDWYKWYHSQDPNQSCHS